MPFKYTDPDTGQIKEFTYDVSDDPNNEFKSAEQEPITKDVGTDTTGWDINKKTKRTIGQYLNKMTHGQEGPSKRGNEFGIDAEQTSLEINDPSGNPVSPNIQHTGANQGSEGYLKNVRDIPELGYRSTSEDYTDAVQKTNFAVRKGVFKSQTTNASLNGNSLLKSVDITNETLRTDPENSKVVTGYVSSVLAHNRFSNTAKVTDLGNEVTVKIGTDVGVNNLQDNTHNYDQQRLANVGLILSLRASGEWGSTKDGANPTSGAFEAKALLPGFNQMGIDRIGPQDFDVKQILSTLTTSEDVNQIDPAKLSWGAMNNVHDQYFGAGAIGMQVLSVSLLVAILLVFEVFGLLFGMLSKPDFRKSDKSGRHYLGQYKRNSKNDDGGGFIPKIGPELLGLAPTENPYKDCVEEGLKAFYGIDDVSLSSVAKKAASAALSAVMPTQDTPGQQIAISRTILRSSLAIKDAFSNLGGNPLSIIKGILGIIDVIKRSKFIVAMNLFALLGDQILNNVKIYQSLGIDWDTANKSLIDTLDLSKSNAAMKSRINPGGSLNLAWSTYRSPLLMQLPSSIASQLQPAASLGSTPGSAIIAYHSSLPGSDKMSLSVNKTGRISTSDREKFEATLESEYVPFYFHDLRTNEIIAFHAFLQSLNDSYTAGYESVEGIGRIDPVKIYKNTQRKLDMMFFVVATSEQDFDIMWLKINKLLTMIYPQYTRGRMIFDGNSLDESKNVIVQPFSQVISASPLIRLRIGDVIKSNYTKFNLARLFGLGTPEMKLDGRVLSASDAVIDDKVIDAISSEIDKLQNSDGVPASDYKVEINHQAQLYLANPSDFYQHRWSVGGTDDAGIITPSREQLSCTVTKFNDDGTADVKVALKGPDEMGPEEYQQMMSWENTRWQEQGITGQTFVVARSALSYTQKTIDKITKKFAGTGESNVQKLQNFMSEDGNALVKSFKETGGKGLAGVIESLNFHWIDNVPWEISPGCRAPMICKINLNFSPIHDIPPGLDYNGYDRAPVYPVAAGNSHPKAK